MGQSGKRKLCSQKKEENDGKDARCDDVGGSSSGRVEGVAVAKWSAPLGGLFVGGSSPGDGGVALYAQTTAAQAALRMIGRWTATCAQPARKTLSQDS